MAVSQQEKTSTIYINVEVSTDKYKNRAFQSINPDITDAKAYTVSMLFGGLQAHSINKIKRRNEYTILNDE